MGYLACRLPSASDAWSRAVASRCRRAWRCASAVALLPALLLVAVLAVTTPAAAQSASERAVNPLTGTPLSLEQMHWSLEQARLEEQLQASLLNRRKFELERQRLDLAAGGGPLPGIPAGLEGGLPASVAPGRAAPGAASPAGSPGLVAGAALPAAANAAPATLAAPAVPAAPMTPVRARRASAAMRAAPGLAVVGVRARGSEWCLLVSEEASLHLACRGEVRAGHRIDAVSAQDYRIDGVTHALEIPPARLRAPALAAGNDDADPAAPVLVAPAPAAPAPADTMATADAALRPVAPLPLPQR